MPPHHFTLEEANAALQVIRPLMDEIQSIRKRVLEAAPDLWPAMQSSAGNGGNAALSKMMGDFNRLDHLVHKILATGVEIKDLGSGLLDFRALRSGGEVYLCWKHGEDRIRYWHELDSGFAGRRPLEEF